MKENLEKHLPMAPATLHILLALAGEDMHGYGIMQEVSRQSEGRYQLGPGTLYDNLQKLMANGMVDETDGPAGADPRRKYYRLAAFGRKVLSAEVTRLEGVVQQARLHLTMKPRRS